MRRLNSFFGSNGRAVLATVACLCLALSAGAGDRGLYSTEASRSAADKFRQIEEGASSGRPVAVRVAESELNAYLEDTQSDLPPGITAIHLKLQPSRPAGTAEIDFDRLKGSMKNPPNPLISLFLRGEHTLGVDGTFTSSNGEGQFKLETVTLDGITVPQMIVDYMIDNYVKSHYPDVPINRSFPLGYNINQIAVEAGSVMVTGKQLTAGAKQAPIEKVAGAGVTPVRAAARSRIH